VGKGVSDSCTVPVNPLTGVTVIVEVAVWPVLAAAGDVAATVNPLTWNSMLAVGWDREPLAPVTVKSNEPTADAVHERIVCASAGRVIEGGWLQARPNAGGIAVNDTVPVKPFRGVIVIVVEQAIPITHGTVVGVDGEMSKSGGGTVTVTVTFWINDPLVPVTFTRYVPGERLLAAVMLS
jgi:hypothetical protein